MNELHEMDNQQPSSEQEKVQRLFRREVPDDYYTYIIWEAPRTNNTYYLYTLSSEIDRLVKYVGITTDPKRRLRHHINYSQHNPHKKRWIDKQYKNGYKVYMTVLNNFDDYDSCVIAEENMIDILGIDTLINIESNPTRPGCKEIYVYDFIDETKHHFECIQQAGQFIGIQPAYLNMCEVNKNRYMCSEENLDYDNFIEKNATIKSLNKSTNEVLYYINTTHASSKHNISLGSINNNLSARRKSTRNYVFAYVDQSFPDSTHARHKRVLCLDDNKEFENMKLASEFYGIDLSGIVKVCKGKRTHCGGKRFRYL
jgi:predicted GIY-YIG superfamily endonuclease